jgi:pyruvate formate lyase activating enzyme
MRCVYCYNPDIVLGKGTLGYEQALGFLEKRKGLLDGVVLSGGECTMHHGLPEFMAAVRRKGFAVKIDTNGSSPRKLREWLRSDLVNYVSLDLKAPQAKFRAITKSRLYDNFLSTLRLLLSSGTSFEVRTTVHADLHGGADIQEMADLLVREGYRGRYYLQRFVNDTETLGKLPNSGKICEVASINTPLEIVLRN